MPSTTRAGALTYCDLDAEIITGTKIIPPQTTVQRLSCTWTRRRRCTFAYASLRDCIFLYRHRPTYVSYGKLTSNQQYATCCWIDRDLPRFFTKSLRIATTIQGKSLGRSSVRLSGTSTSTHPQYVYRWVAFCTVLLSRICIQNRQFRIRLSSWRMGMGNLLSMRMP